MKFSVLEKIDIYMKQNRQVGHTTTMLAGANNIPNALIVVANLMHAKTLRLQPGRYITFDSIKNDNDDRWMRGRRDPIVIDNGAWYLITREAQEVMRKRYGKINE